MLQLLLLRNLFHLIIIQAIYMFREKYHLLPDIFVQMQRRILIVHPIQIFAMFVQILSHFKLLNLMILVLVLICLKLLARTNAVSRAFIHIILIQCSFITFHDASLRISIGRCYNLILIK